MAPGLLPPDDADDATGRDLREGLRNADPETLRAFVVLAVVVQAGLFAASLGVMLVWFRGQRLLGTALALGGLLALGASFALYRKRRG
jgi:small-conductance mechanosensitive channel